VHPLDRSRPSPQGGVDPIAASEPANAVTPSRQDDNEHGGKEQDEHRRARQNIAVLALLVVLLSLGLWLFAELRAYLKIEACIEAGYRNCGAQEK
jgi:hypothetical protein